MKNVPEEPTAEKLTQKARESHDAIESYELPASEATQRLSQTARLLDRAADRLAPMDDPPLVHGDRVRVDPEDGEPFDAEVRQWGHGTAWVWTGEGWKVHVARWQDEREGMTYVVKPSEIESVYNEVGVAE